MSTASKLHNVVLGAAALPKPRNIILCFDGTGNEFDDTNTNIVRLFSILRVDCPDAQVCYYQAGIGTYVKPGAVRPMFNGVAGLIDKAIAWYLPEHITDGYKFLMQNYREGDTICIFGFSRGAYTARALAGMLHKVGLLSKDNFEQIPFAYRIFKEQKEDEPSVDITKRFKKTFCREVVIDFLGVWDTVASVGLLWSPTLPFVGSNDMIRVFRHAVSLDERRARFRPHLYHKKTTAELPTQSLLGKITDFVNPFKAKYLKRGPETHTECHPHRRGEETFETDIKEVWFAGAHSDVGGGNTKDNLGVSLSNVSLRWMVRQIANASKTVPHFKILFDHAALAQWNIQDQDISPSKEGEVSDAVFKKDKDRHAQVNKSKRAEKDKEFDTDSGEVKEKSRDELWKGGRWWAWWPLEILPAYYEWQDKEGRWMGQWKWNWGHGRFLPFEPAIHESVDTRKKLCKGYTPAATQKPGHEGSEYYVQ